MSIATQEELINNIYSHYELKDNVQYLIYFDHNPDLLISVTDGLFIWRTNLSSNSFADEVLKNQLDNLTLVEFLKNLINVLKLDEVEISKLLDSRSKEDFIEFKTFILPDCRDFTKTWFKILLQPVKSNNFELKNLIFDLFKKFHTANVELKKFKIKCELDSLSSNNTRQLEDELKSGHDQTLKKNSISSSVGLISRKSGMSIINPKKKRKNIPKGVEFEGGDDDDDNEEEFPITPKKSPELKIESNEALTNKKDLIKSSTRSKSNFIKKPKGSQCVKYDEDSDY